MTITAASQVQVGNLTTVTVTSDLTPPIYYHWYEDGQWVASTQTPTYTFWIANDETLVVDVIDTEDVDFDYMAAQPGYPARRTISWVRSPSADVAKYVISQSVDNGDWENVGEVQSVPGQWVYSFLTDRLTDLSAYEFRITPVDTAGNEGMWIGAGSNGQTGGGEDVPSDWWAANEILVVRRPDAPNYTVAFNAGATTVTFTEVA
jgi:hypothetical protein